MDAYEAMTQKRTYRSSLSEKEALQELQDNAGSQFDPNVVKEFIAMINLKKANRDNQNF